MSDEQRAAEVAQKIIDYDPLPSGQDSAVVLAEQYLLMVKKTEERLTRLEKLADFAERTMEERDRWAREAFRLAEAAGWQPFGSGAAEAVRGGLEFDGKDSAGMPLWERVHTETATELQVWLGDRLPELHPEAVASLTKAIVERYAVRRRSS